MTDEHPVRSRAETARAVGVLGLVLVAAIFAIVNLDEVKVDWIVTSSQTPLIVVIGLSWLLGVLTAVVGRRIRRARRATK